MSESRDYFHRQRAILFAEQRGLCHWCKEPMALVIHDFKGGIPKKFKRATLDHLDSKLNEERGQHAGERRRVVACDACNAARAKAEEEAMTLEQRQQRSKRFPSVDGLPLKIPIGEHIEE